MCGIGCSTLPSSNDAKSVSLVVTPGDTTNDSAYRLQVGDTLNVHYMSYPDLDDSATIGPDGHVALRLTNDFQIAGLTIADATKATNDSYKGILNHPGITLTIRSYSLQQVYVSGEVNSPGVIRSNVPLTAATAVAQAGGMKLATAHPDDALLLRRRLDGSVAYYRLNFHADLPSPTGDPLLRNNDMIYVPRTAISSVADWVQANVQRMLPISGSATYYIP
jgi:polysaccharide export outer membrane protein